MKSIYILRHAKAAQTGEESADFERALRRRGRAAAVAVAKHIQDNGLHPDLILCSTARRARETAAPLFDALSATTDATFERALYLADESALLARLQKAPDAKSAILLVGHNPGLQELVLLLASKGQPELRKSVAEKFPTAALAHLRFNGRTWRELAPGSAALVSVAALGGRGA
jgi:phosphohistidine phosphatase